MTFFEILLAILAGMALGVITGMIPGIHINLVAAMMLSVSGYLLEYFDPLSLAVAIIAMSITHVFVDFIPSVFFGAPSDATALAVLPGHKLLLEGRGYEAVILSSTGALWGVIAVAAAIPLLLLSVGKIFDFLQPHMGIILAGIVAYNIFRQKGSRRRILSSLVFLMAGLLGIIALGIPNLNQPLLPLLAGLFGLSTLISSMINRTFLPIQVCERKPLASPAKSVAAGTFSGCLMGIFPALGPAQAAMLARNLLGKSEKRAYLATLGAVSSSAMLFGLVTLLTIGKARNGSIAIMSEIAGIGFPEFILLMAVAVATAGMSFLSTAVLGKVIAENVYRISYHRISLGIMLFVTGLTFTISGPAGITILFAGAAIGLFAIFENTERHNLMGCLMLPVILYYI